MFLSQRQPTANQPDEDMEQGEEFLEVNLFIYSIYSFPWMSLELNIILQLVSFLKCPNCLQELCVTATPIKPMGQTTMQ